MRSGLFEDPRLVAVYDAEHVWGWDDDFFMSVLAERTSPRVLDLGCGTGRLAIAMAGAGHEVTGVEPGGAALMAARGKPGGERVRWVHGSAESLPVRAYETVLLTGHVAQSFVGDKEWLATLRALRRALVGGGRLILNSGDPAAQPWTEWNREDSLRSIVLPDGATVRAWTEIASLDLPVVTLTHHFVFTDGDELTSSATVRFRNEGELRSLVEAAGFDVDRVYGGWSREGAGLSADGELILLAVARPQRTA